MPLPHAFRTAAVALLVTLCPLAADLRTGFGESEINAPVGTPLAGYYHPRGCEGVLDDLKSKAMVIDDGDTKAAIVVLDLIETTRPLVGEARAEIERRTGIPGSHVMIAATHTHTAPTLRTKPHPAAVEPPAGEASREYLAGLPARIAASVQRALSNAQLVSLSIARGECDDLTFNRRFYMRDGSVGWNPGKLNPQIMLPAGVTDPEVLLLLVESAAPAGAPGRPLGAFINFAMHPDTTGGTLLSADYPGALSRQLGGYFGPDFTTVFANGTCGNLNHLDVNWNRPQGGPREANRIGTVLAASVFRAYKAVRPLNAEKVRVKSRIVELPLPEICDSAVEQAKADVANAKDGSRDGFMRLVRAHRILDIDARQGKPWAVEVQVIALGGQTAWVSLPGEIFVELGLAIKKRSPFEFTALAELANGSIGYIPDRRSFAEGNYEPESARCLPGAGETLVDAASQLLEELHLTAKNELDGRAEAR